ncbi:hypothetical protein [Endozoicomonas sp. GU-1]|uniref:hypothetical protein n=1 Tax=Endozoicomonas sp. GU-1 TaxID=3009078 RepID=UPI0022B43542|nr:hypothetical protein [Endozoicomonas sp. GU-1]WBA81072.1 hypothetical protein O2T12_22685 [Endozoicomonas sp. GU-1]WBA88636.1 hypothetical protein O3276_11865 [Endozoicomonas sp. GU-1]
MINNAVENITYYVKAAIKLPLNIVRWFCGRVVAIAHNISNFLSKRSDQNDSSDVQQKDISDRTVSSSDSQPTYHVRETVTTAVFPFGNLEKILECHRGDFESAEAFAQAKTKLLKDAEDLHLWWNETDMLCLKITTKTNAEGKQVTYRLGKEVDRTNSRNPS